MQVIINKYKNKNIIVIEYDLSWSRISALFHENPASRTFFHHFTESRVFSCQVKKTNCCKSQNLTWTLALLTDILTELAFPIPSSDDEAEGKGRKKRRGRQDRMGSETTDARLVDSHLPISYFTISRISDQRKKNSHISCPNVVVNHASPVAVRSHFF